jgi:hypothetical protein
MHINICNVKILQEVFAKVTDFCKTSYDKAKRVGRFWLLLKEPFMKYTG